MFCKGVTGEPGHRGSTGPMVSLFVYIECLHGFEDSETCRCLGIAW